MAGPESEVLSAPGFRLLNSPQEIVHWPYHYVSRSFSLPSYRTPEGVALPGWSYRLIPTRRFFTDQSARIYYRNEDLRQSRVFPFTKAAATPFGRIWPMGTTVVLETFSGKTALNSDAAPSAIDALHKFRPHAADFPLDTLAGGEWSYQRFGADGRVRPMPAGASGCHQCHATALHLTGDLIFTIFRQEWRQKKTTHSFDN